MTEPNLSSFLWSVADLLRGDAEQSERGEESVSAERIALLIQGGAQ